MPEGALKPIDFKSVERPASVRIATPADELKLFRLLLKLDQDNTFGVPRSDARVWQHVTALCGGQKGIAGIMEDPQGNFIGSVGIMAAQPWYSEVWYLCMVWLFIDPEHRTAARADDLFKFALWHQVDMEARLHYKMALEISVISPNRLAAKERLWARHAKKIGAIFWIPGDNR